MNLVDGPQQLPRWPVSPAAGHEKAVTIRNDVNIKKETLRVEPDHDNPGEFLVAFTFDATAPGWYILYTLLHHYINLVEYLYIIILILFI